MKTAIWIHEWDSSDGYQLMPWVDVLSDT